MRSAVVVGAGVGGLAVAGALARSGWQVTVLERAERVRPEPTAVVLWPQALAASSKARLAHRRAVFM